jgi:hypothetical protein
MAELDDTVDLVTDQLAQGRSLVPGHLFDGILNHVLGGRGTGGFLAAVFSNDALEVACRADDVSLARLPDIMRFMHNYTPLGCWGSREKAARWRELGGIRGGAHLAEEPAHG